MLPDFKTDLLKGVYYFVSEVSVCHLRERYVSLYCDKTSIAEPV